MKEYIERAAALRIIDKYGCSNGSVIGYHSGAVDCAGSEIARIPAADVVKVRHGRWLSVLVNNTLSYYPAHGWKCSCCGHEIEDRSKEPHYPEQLKYCPNCGAKMDKEE